MTLIGLSEDKLAGSEEFLRRTLDFMDAWRGVREARRLGGRQVERRLDDCDLKYLAAVQAALEVW